MSVEKLIGDMPLFKNFTEKEIKQFCAKTLPVVNYKKNELIIKEGEMSTTLFLLISGCCLITKSQADTTIRLSKLSPGEIFGEMSWVSGKPRQSNVVANENVQVLKMDQDFFNGLKPEIGNRIKDFLIELLISRLDNMNEAIMRISKLMRS